MAKAKWYKNEKGAGDKKPKAKEEPAAAKKAEGAAAEAAAAPSLSETALADVGEVMKRHHGERDDSRKRHQKELEALIAKHVDAALAQSSRGAADGLSPQEFDAANAGAELPAEAGE